MTGLGFPATIACVFSVTITGLYQVYYDQYRDDGADQLVKNRHPVFYCRPGPDTGVGAGMGSGRLACSFSQALTLIRAASNSFS
jgi:hypothetical protein